MPTVITTISLLVALVSILAATLAAGVWKGRNDTHVARLSVEVSTLSTTFQTLQAEVRNNKQANAMATAELLGNLNGFDARLSSALDAFKRHMEEESRDRKDLRAMIMEMREAVAVLKTRVEAWQKK